MKTLQEIKDEVAKEDNLCGITFPRNDFKDVTGCLKPLGHNDSHICKTESGQTVEWESDYKCDCGCWDEGGISCVVYSFTEDVLK